MEKLLTMEYRWTLFERLDKNPEEISKGEFINIHEERS